MSTAWKGIVAAVVTVMVLSGCNARINSPIVVRDGESRSSGLSTVNGAIDVGRDAVVRGRCRSVNGSISVDDRAKVDGLSTVNGSIRTGDEVTVDGDVESVNGSIVLRAGARVAGEVASVNGRIDIQHTLVEQDLRTVNGRISLTDGSVVKGNVVYEDKWGSSTSRKSIDVEISGGSVIEGDFIVEAADLQVRILLEEGSEIRGRIANAEVVKDAD